MHVPPAQNSANLRLGNANRPRGNVNLRLRNANLGLRNANLWLRNANLPQRNVRLPSAHAGPPLLHVDVGLIHVGERLTNIHPTRADAGEGWAKRFADVRQSDSDSERRQIRAHDLHGIEEIYSPDERA
jgi:hypothetical protein